MKSSPSRSFRFTFQLACAAVLTLAPFLVLAAVPEPLPTVRVAKDGRGFVTSAGQPFVPFGVNYFRPGTGWAPQVWKQFDAEATRKDFARLKQMGGNCVRVFLSFGSFYQEPGKLAPDGLAKFDQFLSLAEEAGLYVHPTGPDHWEGLPEWARGDRIADDHVLTALEDFWRLLAARYRGRTVLFAYDLLNEPEVRWDTPAMKTKWRVWLTKKYGTAEALATAWNRSGEPAQFDAVSVPTRDAKPGAELLDFQRFREDVADEWTRRQVAAIKSADPQALVTVGLIQWSVPVGIAAAWHYSGFRPARQAPLLDFMEVHFYPLANGFYEYRNDDDEQRNLAYLETVVREVARFNKPTVIAEFGWYGGGKPTINNGAHAFASEEQQARWFRRAIETTAGWAQGWLNWSFHDHPGAGDVTELIGLLTADGRKKAAGHAFSELAPQLVERCARVPAVGDRPALDWESLLVDVVARDQFRTRYLEAWKADARRK